MIKIALIADLHFRIDDHYEVEHRRIQYDRAILIKEMEQLQVPDRELIIKAFFGE